MHKKEIELFNMLFLIPTRLRQIFIIFYAELTKTLLKLFNNPITVWMVGREKSLALRPTGPVSYPFPYEYI